MSTSPIGESCRSCRPRIHTEQACHQCFYLRLRDEHIIDQPANHPTCGITEHRRHAETRPLQANNVPQCSNQAAAGECLRANHVDDDIRTRLASRHRQFREVLDACRLQTIHAITEHTEDRKTAQDPDNVVDKNIFYAQDHSGSQNRTRDSGLDQGVFELASASKMLERRALIRVRDADVYNALNARAPGLS